MRHPFDGINTTAPADTARRGVLKGLFAAIAGLFVTSRAAAVAPPTTKVVVTDKPDAEPTDPKKPGPVTDAIGEDGGGRVTTFAVGEEGAMTKAVGEAGGGRVTTKAIGEEGAGVKPSTRALGEEGGKPPVGGAVTTLALGEEGGKKE